MPSLAPMTLKLKVLEVFHDRFPPRASDLSPSRRGQSWARCLHPGTRRPLKTKDDSRWHACRALWSCFACLALAVARLLLGPFGHAVR